MKNIFYHWTHRYTCPPRWMAFAYYSAERNSFLFVIYPFHFLVALAWWIQDRWARHTHHPSWIENEVRHRLDHHKASTRNQRSF
jgi:hypothetical protein